KGGSRYGRVLGCRKGLSAMGFVPLFVEAAVPCSATVVGAVAGPAARSTSNTGIIASPSLLETPYSPRLARIGTLDPRACRSPRLHLPGHNSLWPSKKIRS